MRGDRLYAEICPANWYVPEEVETLATAFDVASYIVSRKGPLSAMKLQKLLYYSQAWALVWDDRPIFHERIEAWVNGPVVVDVYEKHRGEFLVSRFDGDPSVIERDHRESIDKVLDHYGRYNAQQLSDLTHSEDPWKDARKGLDPTDRGNREITHAMMAEYYSSLTR